MGTEMNVRLRETHNGFFSIPPFHVQYVYTNYPIFPKNEHGQIEVVLELFPRTFQSGKTSMIPVSSPCKICA